MPLTPEIATHIYVAILTDTGSFHYSSISPRTFDICRQCVEAGVDPPWVARSIFDSNNLGRLKLFGAVLSKMELDPTGRLATVYVDQRLASDCGGTYEDTEGLINLPLTVKEIQAVGLLQGARPRRLAHQHAVEGRGGHQRGGEAVWRRRPQECVRLQRHRPIAELKALPEKITEQIEKPAAGSRQPAAIRLDVLPRRSGQRRDRAGLRAGSSLPCPLPAAAAC